jgi:hypothetical protein
MSDFDVPALLAARVMELAPEPLPPLFVMHDLKDREVSVRFGQELVRRWPAAVFRTTSGLGHSRILVDPAVVAQVVAFVAHGVAADGRQADDRAVAAVAAVRPDRSR